jgi:flagellar motor switch protein FliN/FliY
VTDTPTPEGVAAAASEVGPAQGTPPGAPEVAAPGGPVADAVASAPMSPEPGLEAPQATPHDFGELAATASGGGGGSLNMLLDLMMPVSVELGRTAMTVREVLDLTRGSVIPLNRLAGEPIDIYVSDRKLAEGEVVVLGEHFGVRLTRIVSSGAAVAQGASSQPEVRSA